MEKGIRILLRSLKPNHGEYQEVYGTMGYNTMFISISISISISIVLTESLTI